MAALPSAAPACELRDQRVHVRWRWRHVRPQQRLLALRCKLSQLQPLQHTGWLLGYGHASDRTDLLRAPLRGHSSPQLRASCVAATNDRGVGAWGVNGGRCGGCGGGSGLERFVAVASRGGGGRGATVGKARLTVMARAEMACRGSRAARNTRSCDASGQPSRAGTALSAQRLRALWIATAA